MFSRRRSAFTLVELLVVIGIISLLISILMPALNRARKMAQRTQCLAQMQQVGIALNTYVAEYKGYTPVQPNNACSPFADPATLDDPNVNARSVLGTLLSYMSGQRRVLACPTASPDTWTGWGMPTEYSDTNFMGNQAVLGKKITRVRGASNVILYQEDRFRWSHAWLRPAENGAIGNRPVYSGWAFPNGPVWGQEYSTAHEMGGNLLFVDGHCEWRHNTTLRARDFGFTGGPGVTGLPDDPNHFPVHFGINYYSIFDQ